MQEDAADRGAVVHHLPRRPHDFGESFADLVEEPRASRHRIPQQPVHVVAISVADHEDLQVVQVHVENACRTENGALRARSRQWSHRLHAGSESASAVTSAKKPTASGVRRQRSEWALRNSSRCRSEESGETLCPHTVQTG